ncbi:MAG: class I SAM-dependent methyltransferase [Flavobacteriales bacterium]
MKTKKNYLEINKSHWEKRVDTHVSSDFYDHHSFLDGKITINAFESAYLQDIKGKKVLHLQCHFGQDSMSLVRMGAKEVVGVDFSEKAIDFAQKTAQDLDLNARFICCDIYSLADHLNEQFDLVFTSYGTIGWLPDLEPWGAIISKFLKPKGQFLIADFHPVFWMYGSDYKSIEYSYFNTEAIVEIEEHSYADKSAALLSENIGWNHSFDEIFTALKINGLFVEDFKEYNYSPYPCFDGMEKIAENKFQISAFGDKMPLVFLLNCRKKA